jgi:hypothetical protein
MSQTITIEMDELPISGGNTDDPSVLRRVEKFLSQESHLRKVNQMLQDDGCYRQYLSLIDCLVAELDRDFKRQCTAFYEDKEKSLSDLHPAEEIEAIDQELALILEVLVSKKWQSWTDFKRDYKGELKFEPLSNAGVFFYNRIP